MGKKQRSPNDQKSDAMNPNNPLSKNYFPQFRKEGRPKARKPRPTFRWTRAHLRETRTARAKIQETPKNLSG